jgi:hypothetical protein
VSCRRVAEADHFTELNRHLAIANPQLIMFDTSFVKIYSGFGEKQFFKTGRSALGWRLKMVRLPMARQKSRRDYLTLLHIICFVVICCLYGSLFTYYCIATPTDVNTVTSQEPQIAQSVSVNAARDDLGQNASKDIHGQEAKECPSSKKVSRGTAQEDSLGSEFYLSQITSFYQNMITWLFAIIGAILAVNYLYIRASSRAQAEEMAEQALERPGFLSQLDKKLDLEVGKKWANADITTLQADIEELKAREADIEELKARIQFLEGSVTAASYMTLKDLESGDSPKEGQNGDNQK